MSNGGFDANNNAMMYQRYDNRRPSGTFTGSHYNRPFNHPPRRRSPSPGSSRHPSYTPTRVDSPYWNDNPNSYRPNVYRPDYPATDPWEASPSPDAYAYPRPADTETRDRSNTWHTHVKNQPSWQERKPPSPLRERGRRDDLMATRIFEPSDSWKRDHNGRPGRFDGADRHPPHRRPSGDGLPDRLVRNDRNLPPLHGDRYCPPQELLYGARTDYDSYRPSYDDSRVVREIPSPTLHRKGPSGPYPKRPQADFRGNGSYVSPKLPHRLPGRRTYGTLSMIRDFYPKGQKNYESRYSPSSDHDRDSRSRSPPSRPSSRSSIASTAPSEKPYTPSRSTLSLAPERPPSVQGNTSPEYKEATESRLSPSPCPPGLQSLGHVPASLAVESKTDLTETPPFRAQRNEDDITEEAEVKDLILSQNQSQTDLTCDQSKQPQTLASSSKGRADSLSRNISPPSLRGSNSPPPNAIQVSATLTGQNGATDAQLGRLESREAQTPPPGAPSSSKDLPTSTPASDDRQLAETHKQFDSLNDGADRVSGIPTPKTARAPGEALPVKARSTRLRLTTRISEPAFDSQLSTPSIEPTRRTSSKSTPPTPFSEPTPAFNEVTVEGKPALKERLRVVVMTRLYCDHQTREERVDPVLQANLSLVAKSESELGKQPDAEGVVREVLEGTRFENQAQRFEELRPSLAEFFAQRTALINHKIRELRHDYVQLQDKWANHCQMLNEQAKPSILEGETMPIGRTTRRTANLGTLGDAVRSDLEMEQILASLESNDATDPHYLSQYNLATIPDMVSVRNGQIDYLYDDNTHRVENPAEYYAPHTGIHDWTEAEKKTFLDKYAAYPKQFGIIADSLPNKTSSQCIDYYYLHKKGLIDFRKVVSKFGPKRRRRGAGKRKGNALLTDIQRHDEEVHRGSASASISASTTIAPSASGRRGRRHKDKEKEREKETETEKEKGKDKEKPRESQKERVKEKEKDKDVDREKDSEKEKVKEKTKQQGNDRDEKNEMAKEKDKEKEKSKEKDKKKDNSKEKEGTKENEKEVVKGKGKGKENGKQENDQDKEEQDKDETKEREKEEKQKGGDKEKEKLVIQVAEVARDRAKESPMAKVESGRKVSARAANKRTVSQMQDFSPTDTATPTPEPESKGRRKRAGATTASTPTSSRTLSLNLEGKKDQAPEPAPRPTKRPKRVRKVKSAAIVEDESSTPELESGLLPNISLSAPPTGTQALEQDKIINSWPQISSASIFPVDMHGPGFKQPLPTQVYPYYSSELLSDYNNPDRFLCPCCCCSERRAFQQYGHHPHQPPPHSGFYNPSHPELPSTMHHHPPLPADSSLNSQHPGR